MGRNSIGPISAREAALAFRRVERFYQEMKNLVDFLEKHPGADPLWIFKVASLEDGMERFDAFIPEIGRACDQYVRGTPQTPSSTKSRKAKKAARDKELADKIKRVSRGK